MIAFKHNKLTACDCLFHLLGNFAKVGGNCGFLIIGQLNSVSAALTAVVRCGEGSYDDITNLNALLVNYLKGEFAVEYTVFLKE